MKKGVSPCYSCSKKETELSLKAERGDEAGRLGQSILVIARKEQQ